MNLNLLREVRLPILAVAAALGIAVSTHFPALSQQAGRIIANTTCASANPCVTDSNTSTGPALKGTSAKGIGLVGQTSFKSTSFANHTSGVFGKDATTLSIYNLGVEGTSSLGVGVLGSTQTGYAGVYGQTFNPKTAATGDFGVEGVDQTTDGGTANSGTAGFSNSGNGLRGGSGSGAGVFGFSTSGTGMVAVSGSTTGLFAQGSPAALIESLAGTGTQDNLVSFDGSGNETARLDNAGNLHLSGKVFTSGSCSTGCAITHTTAGADVIAYHPRAATPTIEDVGEGRLVAGNAYVRLERGFAQTIDARAPYYVFITPGGDTRGLYVINKTSAGFYVRESQGGAASVSFDYRIVAKPADMSSVRLPESRLSPAGHTRAPSIPMQAKVMPPKRM